MTENQKNISPVLNYASYAPVMSARQCGDTRIARPVYDGICMPSSIADYLRVLQGRQNMRAGITQAAW